MSDLQPARRPWTYWDLMQGPTLQFLMKYCTQSTGWWKDRIWSLGSATGGVVDEVEIHVGALVVGCVLPRSDGTAGLSLCYLMI